MEDDPNILTNGKRPQFFPNGTQPQFFGKKVLRGFVPKTWTNGPLWLHCDTKIEDRSRHGKSGDLCNPGSRKILQIAEDLIRITKSFCYKAFQQANKCLKGE